MPGFRDVASQSGIDFRMSFLPQEQGETWKLNLYDHGCGVALADYDGDGDDDVLLLNQLGANGLYRNRGDGTFENATAEAGPWALDDRICVGAAFGDYDNDGDQDLYITSTRGGNVLLRNQGRGKYRDVTHEAGAALVAHSQTPAFFDCDNDGYLDLFVTNTAHWTTEQFDEKAGYYLGDKELFDHVFDLDAREPNVLFHNNRDGTFSDVTPESGLSGEGWGGDVAAFDFDEDDDLDVLITNMFGTSHLYRNDGRGHFDDVTREALGRTSLGAIGSTAFDFDNDGRLDLFLADMHSDMWIPYNKPELVEPHKKYPRLWGPTVDFQPEQMEQETRLIESLRLDYQDLLFGNSLFHNDGEGRFSEVSDQAGMETFWPWGVAAGDFDNDGDVDAFLPSGMGYPYFYWPSALMLNNGDGTFTDRAEEEGIEPPLEGELTGTRIHGIDVVRSSRCAATADFNGDGRLDLIVNNFNDHPYYFQNRFPRRHYVAFRLTGTKSNRDAVGALVKLHSGGRTLVRQVHSSGGYLSQCSKTLHFGLGDDSPIDKVEIRWPGGKRQIMTSLPIDRLHEIVEP
ncbi:MAG TPA: CRTAC1 family protein [Pirellulales bacterium]|nr:CRTAC1 family protein [Pirellulales bacterium]